LSCLRPAADVAGKAGWASGEGGGFATGATEGGAFKFCLGGMASLDVSRGEESVARCFQGGKEGCPRTSVHPKNWEEKSSLKRRKRRKARPTKREPLNIPKR